MHLNQKNAHIKIPDNVELDTALQRTTHLAIGAHPDDLEIFAYHAITECFRKKDKWFTGITVTNGSGSTRNHAYKDYSDEQMIAIRRQEQDKAAIIGEYAAQFQLDYPSSLIKTKTTSAPAVEDLFNILKATQPSTVYLHNPADKHSTHIAVLHRSIEALRKLPHEQRPSQVYGCEVWRDLDWLLDSDKVALSTSQYPNLAAALIGVYDSQISGGKRYDLATMGRRMANATFHESHATDAESGITWALDLTPIIQDNGLSLQTYISNFLDNFKEDVINSIKDNE